ncbi:hypothetical protein DL96DRAFT_495114 [Flagelloscypha sp. PMI_526]|nr:hypothetical protein DL96DRAFT_495114 [Flagelloscypha sp. PMI_526]
MGILGFLFELLDSDAIPWDIHPDHVPVLNAKDHSADPMAARAQMGFHCLSRLCGKYCSANRLPIRFCRTIMQGWPSLLHWSTFFMNLSHISKPKFLIISDIVTDTWAILIDSNREYFIPRVIDMAGAFELYSRIWFSAINTPNEVGRASEVYYQLCAARGGRGDDPSLDFFRATATTPSIASSTLLSRLLIPQDLRNPILLDVKFAILIEFSVHSREFNDAVVRHGVVMKCIEVLGMLSDPSVSSNHHSFASIIILILRRLKDWIRAGDGTTWMKRALRAGLIRMTMFSVQFYRESSHSRSSK